MKDEKYNKLKIPKLNKVSVKVTKKRWPGTRNSTIYRLSIYKNKNTWKYNYNMFKK